MLSGSKTDFLPCDTATVTFLNYLASSSMSTPGRCSCISLEASG